MKNIFLFLLIPFSLFSQRTYLPKSTGEVTKHSVLTISYSETHEQAEWVYYESSYILTNGVASRQNDFRPDNSISTNSASLIDYKGSGYDRGHLAPAQDMKASSIIMSESFLMSNMSPQTAAFNRGGNWRKLEDAVHSWGASGVIVVTGPIFKDNLGKIGNNRVTVPGYYYKAIYSPQKNKMIGFVLPHVKNNQSLVDCAVTIDRIESLTGIDFFPQLNDSIESQLESKISVNSWYFSKSKNKTKSTKTSYTQCRGIAKSTGVRCKSKTKNSNYYCGHHQSQSPDYVKPKTTKYIGQCNGVTKKGSQCKRSASDGSRYCWQHK